MFLSRFQSTDLDVCSDESFSLLGGGRQLRCRLGSRSGPRARTGGEQSRAHAAPARVQAHNARHFQRRPLAADAPLPSSSQRL